MPVNWFLFFRRASYTAAVSYLIVVRFRDAENPIPAIPPSQDVDCRRFHLFKAFDLMKLQR
jgi:hypothetical protein